MLRHLEIESQVENSEFSNFQVNPIEKLSDWLSNTSPLIQLAQLIGLDPNHSSLSSSNLFYKLYCVLCLFLNVAFHSFNFYLTFTHAKEVSVFYDNGAKYSNTYVWNTIIDSINFAAGSLLAHLILIFIFSRRWPSMMEVFDRTQIIFDSGTTTQLKRLSWIRAGYIVLGVSGMATVGAIGRLFTDATIQIKLSGFVEVIFQVYPVLTLALVIHAVDSFNDCFGWSLLLLISYHFVAVINASFYCIGVGNQTTPLPSEILFLIYYLTNIVIACSVVDRIRIQSDGVLKDLFRLKINPVDFPTKKNGKNAIKNIKIHFFCHIFFGLQVNQFAVQAVFCSTRVSALGLFNVSKQLIPTMIGTTITFYVIFYQFHLLER